MPLNKDVSILLIQGRVGMEQSKEGRQLALPIEQLLVQLEHHGIIWWFDGKS
jgi:hypothetical protein